MAVSGGPATLLLLQDNLAHQQQVMPALTSYVLLSLQQAKPVQQDAGFFVINLWTVHMTSASIAAKQFQQGCRPDYGVESMVW